MSNFSSELRSQPILWRLIALRAAEATGDLLTASERACVVGCGTCLFTGQGPLLRTANANVATKPTPSRLRRLLLDGAMN